MSDIRAELARAGAEYKAVRTSLEQARDHLRPLVVDALRAGMTQREIVELTGYTRETIRQLARAHGIEPD
jgi:hypothetical protein